MSFKLKLILAMTFIATLTGVVLFSITYYQASRVLRAQLETTALSVASSVGVLIDGDLHQQVSATTSMSSTTYLALEKQFRSARDSNRRTDVYVKFVFSLIPSHTSTSEWVFAIDAFDEHDQSPPGQTYRFEGTEDTKPIVMGRAMVQGGFIKDQWGTWLEAYAPIYNSQGKAVAMVGVDLGAADVLARMKSLQMQALAALVFAVFLAIGLAYILGLLMSKPLARITEAVLKIGQGDLDVQLEIYSKDEFGQVSDAVNQMSRGLRERANLKSSLARYVSSHVADNILKTGQAAQLTGERRIITVLFSDVRGFTTLSEQMAPEDVVSLLNEYFERMIDIVFRNNGTLDKFIGDGLMAFFGAPVEDPNHAAHAIRAALEMRSEMQELQEKWLKERKIDIRIGVGVHTGLAIVGNIGSNQRMQYTAIGDTVNLAARLESATKEFGVDILVSQDTKLAGASDQFKFEKFQDIQVKGRETPVLIYAVYPGPAFEEKKG